MKLASIINVWDGCELLKYAIKSTCEATDLYVIVYQTESNFGEKYDPSEEIQEVLELFRHKKFILRIYYPEKPGGFSNEVAKRNIGLYVAREHGCTHFYFQDTDELYENFPEAVQAYKDKCVEGTVCPIYTYFRRPTLRFENPDNYFVPFIHKLRPDSVAGTQNYPFYVDPTRSSTASGVVKLDVFMHHFSYIRRDLARKLCNSSAKFNINGAEIMRDYDNAAPGYYVDHIFRQKLIEVPNLFNIEI